MAFPNDFFSTIPVVSIKSTMAQRSHINRSLEIACMAPAATLLNIQKPQDSPPSNKPLIPA